MVIALCLWFGLWLGYQKKAIGFGFNLAVILIFSGFGVSAWKYEWMQGLDQAALSNRAHLYLFTIVASLSLFSSLSKRWLETIGILLFLFGLINSGYLLYQFITHVDAFHRTGFFNNASLSASYSAISLIFYQLSNSDRRVYSHYAFFTLLAVLSSYSSMGILIMSFIYLREFIHRKYWVILAGISGLVLYFIPSISSSNGRLAVWLRTYEIFIDHTHWWANGAGLGGFELWFPKFQSANDFLVGIWFTTAHNDFIQIVFETGITGGLSYALLTAYIFLRAARHNASLRTAWGAFCIGGLGNTLWVHPLLALCGLTIIFLALYPNDQDTKKSRLTHP